MKNSSNEMEIIAQLCSNYFIGDVYEIAEHITVFC